MLKTLKTLSKTLNTEMLDDFFRNFFRNFFKNFFWKAVSVVIALTLWLVSININNPVRERQLSVSLGVQNESQLISNGYTLLNPDAVHTRKLNLTVAAPIKNLNTLNPSLISAYIDFKDINFAEIKDVSQPVLLSVHYNTSLLPNPSVYKIDATATPNIAVSLDNYITRLFAVRLGTKGTIKDGFIRTGLDYNPKEIDISGPQSVLDGITSVTAEVNLGNAADDVAVNSPIVVNNKNGPVTDRIDLSDSTCHIVAQINKTATVPIETPEIFGRPANGYALSGIGISMNSIAIYGKEPDINGLDALILDPLDISGITGTKQFNVDLNPHFAAAHVKPADAAQTSLVVTVNVVQLQSRYIQYPTNLIKADVAQGSYSVAQDNVQLLVHGTPSDLDNLQAGDIAAQMTVSGLPAGANNVPVDFRPPSGITIINTPVYLSVVIPLPPQPVQQSTETSAGVTEQAANAGQAGGTEQAGGAEPGADTGQAANAEPGANTEQATAGGNAETNPGTSADTNVETPESLPG